MPSQSCNGTSHTFTSTTITQDPQDLVWQRIEVIGFLGKACSIDPSHLVIEEPRWRLWIFQGRPRSQLFWDQREWSLFAYQSTDSTMTSFQDKSRLL